MSAPELTASSREERLAFIKDEFRCLHNCEICGKCSFLKGREAEEIYKDYIEGIRPFMEITMEQRQQ